MDEEHVDEVVKETSYSRAIRRQSARKLKALGDPTPVVWIGLGLTGTIGWSIVIPTLLGTVLGLWLDKQYPGRHSWTLALMVAGLSIGCLAAWYWVASEYRSIREDHDE
jgi:ATP synthase protein I